MSAYSILLIGISIFVALISCEKVLDPSLNVQLKIALKPRDIEKLHKELSPGMNFSIYLSELDLKDFFFAKKFST